MKCYKMYISPKAKISKSAIVEGETIILGNTIIGNSTIIGHGTIIGYPVRSKILQLLASRKVLNYTYYDNVSSGSIIRTRCIIRTGSIIYENVHLGNFVETGHNVVIRENTVIGNGSKIGTGTIIDGNVKIGENVSIQSSVYIPPETKIGNNVFLGPRVVITNDKYPPSKRLLGVVIEDNVVVGANSTLIAGVRIGKNSVIAAGAVVTKDVPPGSVVAGVPAKIIGNYEDYVRKREKYEKGEYVKKTLA